MTATNKFSFAGAAAVHVWCASLEAGGMEIGERENLLDPTELARARRFHFERDRHRFTLARGLLRKLVGGYIGMAPEAVRFAAGEYGKPQLAMDGAALRFNLSHSGTQALFAFSQTLDVGIDLEAGARLGEDWPGLARRIFSAREQAELAGLPAGRRRDAFLNGWTRKEAYLKATGQGLVNGLQQIEVTLDPAQPPAFRSADIAGKWTLFDLRGTAGLAAALVVSGVPSSVEFRRAAA